MLKGIQWQDMMSAQVQIDETVCGVLCQHPSCWQSQTRQDKGFPRRRKPRSPSPDIELDLPTLKVCNMLEEYGDDPRDLYPSKHNGLPYHERQLGIPEFQRPRNQGVKVTRAPQTSPKSSTQAAALASQKSGKSFKVVEVQEVFDPEDLQGTWDDTFLSKSYYVWVPNKKKKKRRSKKGKITLVDSQVGTMTNKSAMSVKFRDMTETMVPKELEESRLMSRFDDWPVLKKKHSTSRSPTGRPYTLTPRGYKSDMDMEGEDNDVVDSISELLALPREILVQVLENTRQSDLMSREKIREIIRRFVPPPLERGNTNVSLASNDLLQQRKLSLHPGNKNLRTPHLMETKPVYYIDNDGVDEEEEVDEDMQSHYGSLKEMYFRGGGLSGDLDHMYGKKPLPAIGGGRSQSAVDAGIQTKLPSISLGLPELPSGVRQTKAFTYNKRTDVDFTLEETSSQIRPKYGSPVYHATLKAPVPTPPTSFRSTGTPGSEHGTTIRVNILSEASLRSERGSDIKESPRAVKPSRTGDMPLHAVSPTFSTRVPHAPATTPATVQHHSPTKSSQYIRDSTLASAPAGVSDWPPREKTGSPTQIPRAPVNTPGSIMQEQTETDIDREETWPPKIAGLGTIQESAVAPEEYPDQPVPVSRGRSVRFEIPEVPPPPSSPQLSDRQSPDGQREPEIKEIKETRAVTSEVTVTISATIPKDTPSTSSTNNRQMSGITMRTDQTTINTSSLQAENSFIKTGPEPGPNRELSMVSSPEPWPQVNEADYDVAPMPSPANSLHASPRGPDGKEIIGKGDHHHHVSKNATTEKGGRAKEPVSKILPDAKVAKKRLEDSRKVESPAPPPPSPEGKEEDQKLVISKPNSAVMTPLMEEAENAGTPSAADDETSITVLQVAPKLPPYMTPEKTGQRQIDTFVNIDIPAMISEASDASVPDNQPQVPQNTIVEEPEPEPELEPDNYSPREEGGRSPNNATFSVQSTLAARTISDQGMSEVSSSMIEPAMSQASHGPALSEDYNEEKERPDVTDLSGVVVGSEGQMTEMTLSSTNPDMTEEGGDHEGFKEDLRQEYERLKSETEGESTTS